MGTPSTGPTLRATFCITIGIGTTLRSNLFRRHLHPGPDFIPPIGGLRRFPVRFQPATAVSESSDPQAAPDRSLPWTKLLVLGVVLATAAGLYFCFGDALTLDGLAGHESTLRAYRIDHPVMVFAIAFLVYVVATGLSIPGAAILTIVFGWYFGFGPGLVLVSFASTAGATVAFLLSRYLLRDGIEAKFGDRLESFNENLRREGAFYLFSLRLIPAVPFFVINVVMGLTPMKTWTFWWVSQIGMLAGTIAYVYAGSTFPTLAALSEEGVGGVLTWPLLAAFAVLGLLPIVTKRVLTLFTARKASADA